MCLTSQDVNSLALTLQVKECVTLQIVPLVTEISKLLHDAFYAPHKSVMMLARTHGQPATPTTLGKEMMVFSERLRLALEPLQQHTDLSCCMRVTLVVQLSSLGRILKEVMIN